MWVEEHGVPSGLVAIHLPHSPACLETQGRSSFHKPKPPGLGLYAAHVREGIQ